MVKYFPRIFPLLLMVGAGTAFSQAPNWTKQTPQTMPLTLAFPAMAYDSAHQQTVLFGGYLGVGSLYYEYNITWVWDGTNWTKKTPATNPQPRDSESMVYDSVRGQVVMFGGENLTGSPFGDTWIWDGTTWTLQNTPTAPSARYHTMMAFDAAHGQVVLFGGSDGNGNYYNDTWVWNGTAWSQKTPSASPPARWRGMMTFDSARNQTVMFGGYYSDTVEFNDTWIWDGTNWTLKATKTAPVPRDDGALAFDAAHGQAILYGGDHNSTDYPETWAWDGTNWTQLKPAAVPTAMYGIAMAYDAARQQIVLFGGTEDTHFGYYNDTWTWPAAAVAPPPTLPAITKVISASAFGAFTSVAPGSWVEIYGANLAPDSRPWMGADFTGSNAPTSLDGVQVNIGGQKAAVAYISATQVNAQLPSNIGAGTNQLTVTNGNTTSAAVNLTVDAMEPGLLAPPSFNLGGTQFVVALLPDNVTYILPAGAIAGVNSRPAHSGETVILYGVGFGAVTPATPALEIASGITQLASSFQVTLGGVPAQATYYGLAPGFVGLYQFNIVVPQYTAMTPVAGSANVVPITFTLAGTPGTQTLSMAVQP